MGSILGLRTLTDLSVPALVQQTTHQENHGPQCPHFRSAPRLHASQPPFWRTRWTGSPECWLRILRVFLGVTTPGVRPSETAKPKRFLAHPMIPLHHLRAGVIGTGFIGPVHIEALKRLGVQVTAVCGSTVSARECADQWGIPEVYGDYDVDALVRSSNVDVIHITSPNKALRAGKHVVCEKPLGMNSRETARVVAAVQKPNAPVFAVNYMCRFFPAILQLRAMVARGDLGRIIHVQGHFFQD